MWSHVVVGVMMFILLLLIVRVSEISTRMCTYENFMSKVATQEDMSDYVDRVLGV